MKFRQKIFLITFAFVTISINLIGIITINNNHKKLINERIENNKNNIYNIESMLKFYGDNAINNNFSNNVFYEISKAGKIIYTNLHINKNEIELLPKNSNINVIILNETLYMSTIFDEYEIILADNIEDIAKNKQEEIYFFIRISIIFSFIIAFCLYLTIFLLTKKLSKLDKIVKKVESGDYSARVQKLGNDEIGLLGDSFNKMIISVDENISEIKRVSENRKKFIHDLTHEIRTPLTSIIGYSSLIKNAKIQDMEVLKEYNNKIYEEGNYLNLIADRLINIVLLDGKEIKLENVKISKVFDKIIENNQNIFSGIKFVKNIDENIIVKSDEVLLQSLIINILKNSAQAMENSENKVIEIALDDSFLLKIKDSGKGISEDEIERITEPFYTVNKDRNRKNSGMGLRSSALHEDM